jgi:hypothetical protein
MLYTICTRELFLLTTNFYDDYILASLPNSTESSKNSMELVFMLTGWRFDMDGKKATNFGTVCKALGVQFDLSSSGEKLLRICNTEQRVQDLLAMLDATWKARRAYFARQTGLCRFLFTWKIGPDDLEATV